MQADDLTRALLTVASKKSDYQPKFTTVASADAQLTKDLREHAQWYQKFGVREINHRTLSNGIEQCDYACSDGSIYAEGMNVGLLEEMYGLLP